MKQFTVTFDIYNPDDESGEPSERGTTVEGATLRELVDMARRGWMPMAEHSCTEASALPLEEARWVTWRGLMSYQSGDQVAYSLHIPDSITRASRGRICRLAMGY